MLPFDKYEVVGNLELLNGEMGNGGKKVKNPWFRNIQKQK